MDKIWLSFVGSAVGLMLLVASDKPITADDKQTSHTISFGTEQEIEVFVNKDGDDDAKVQLIIDGKEYEFFMPDIADGETQVITTEDGNEVIVKSVLGNNMILIDGNEMHLPSFGKHTMPAEGLSAMIGRSHQLRLPENISISGHGLSEDIKTAIIDAVEGVLISYDVKKKVSFNDHTSGFHFRHEDMKVGEGNNFQIQIKTSEDHSANSNHVMVIKKNVVIEEKEEN